MLLGVIAKRGLRRDRPTGAARSIPLFTIEEGSLDEFMDICATNGERRRRRPGAEPKRFLRVPILSPIVILL